ncbi:hypothetical protein Sphch_0984 [Sphingobium chlorophenolicum L-1]|uniref:Uncharacterized protein n=1 Tax=Sphingobium chlorophenolicum L-1 TaxID=690566 RepID=F6EU46_SPHCR|nr:hypothetical protein Sphch_0984 [Sphingobium chlorophenolicum L-1]
MTASQRAPFPMGICSHDGHFRDDGAIVWTGIA